MNLIKKLSYILNKRQKIRLAELVVIIFVGAVIELLGISIIMPLISVVTDENIIHNNQFYSDAYKLFGAQSNTQFVIFLFVIVIFIYILKNLYLLFMYDVQFRFTCNNQRKLADKMLECYMQQPYLFHVSNNISELQRNVDTDTAMFFQAVLACLQFFTEACVCVLMVIFLFVTDPVVTSAIAVVLILFSYAFLRLVKNKTVLFGDQARHYDGQKKKWLRQSFEGIKEIKVLNRERFFADQYSSNNLAYMNVYQKYQVINSVPRPVFETVIVVTMLILVVIRIADGEPLKALVPTLSAFVIAVFRLLPSFGRLTSYINTITYNKSAVDAVYHDLKEVESLLKNENTFNKKKRNLSVEKRISIDSLFFKYPEKEEYVLKNISLEIKKGKSVAFIGASGAGKSTLVDVVLGLLKPEKGSVYADSIDVYDEEYGWNENIGYIPQFIYLMDDTIKNNILFGIPHSSSDEEDIWRTLREAQLDDFVKSLEKGLDTEIGERGVRLSGGQRQRIGIARALYNNPDILILDEATSALDNDTEKAVMEAIDILQGKKTLLIIAHRLTTIKNCDYIYEIKDGKIYQRSKESLFL